MKVRIIIKDDQDFLEKIETTLLKQTGLKIKTIRAKTRTREVVRIRCIIAYLIKENTTMTLSSIGNYLNGKDHSSVIHMLNTIEDWKSQPKAWVKELHLLNNLDIALKGYSKNDLIDWINTSNEIPETIKSTIINKIHTFIS
jgi:chromosomal replication initiation ATPase DnaA